MGDLKTEEIKKSIEVCDEAVRLSYKPLSTKSGRPTKIYAAASGAVTRASSIFIKPVKGYPTIEDLGRKMEPRGAR